MIALAGCSSGNGGDSDEANTGGGNNDGCPSLPLSYAEKRIDWSPGFAFEVPADASYASSTTENSAAASIDYTAVDAGDPWSMEIRAYKPNISTVEELKASEGNLGEEVTSEYDLSVDGARVFISGTISITRIVYLPTGSEPVEVRIAPSTIEPSDVACPDVGVAIRRRSIETVRNME